LIGFPAKDKSPAGLTSSAVVGIWDGSWRTGVLVHEFSHVMDQLDLSDLKNRTPAFGGGRSTFSRSNQWRSIATKDTRVPSDYVASLVSGARAATGKTQASMLAAAWLEQFADTGRVAFQAHVMGDLTKYSKSADQVQNQVNGYTTFVGSRIFDVTTCEFRHHEEANVKKTDQLSDKDLATISHQASISRRASGQGHSKHNGIKLIDMPEDYHVEFPPYGLFHDHDHDH
jgi:hypothetical protein